MLRKCSAFIWGLLFLFSCTSNPGDEGKSVFYYNEPAGISSLDPAFARDQSNIWGVNQIFNGLVQFDDQLNILPCLAERWEILDSGKTYVFYLREVFFQKNEIFGEDETRPVKAGDVIFSLERLRNPITASPGAWVLNGVLPGKSGIYAREKSTLVFKLEKPFAPFLSMLANPYCSVVPEEAFLREGIDFRTNPVGTGPFSFSHWDEGSRLVLVRNENYFEKSEDGNKLPFLEAISITFNPNKETAFLEFLQGKVDFLNGIDGPFKDQVLSYDGQLREEYKGKFQLVKAPYLNTEYLAFLVDPNNFSSVKNKKVRQAIASGFDRKEMIQYLRNGVGEPGNGGFIPPGLPGHSHNIGYSFDPQKTKKLLAEAGFPGGKGLPEITLSTTPSYLDYCEFIQTRLAQCGIKVKLETNQGAVHREFVAKSKLQFFRGSWIADYPDSENYLSLFYSKNFSPNGPNTTHFSNPEFDLLYETASAEPNDGIRAEYYKEMDKILMDECPVIILYYDQSVRMVSNQISGLTSNPLNLLNLKRVKKK